MSISKNLCFILPLFSVILLSTANKCTLRNETLQCLPSFISADTNNDGKITSYEYINFANGIAGGDVFSGFPVPLLLSFSYLSCLCKNVGESEDCCTRGRPHISISGAKDPFSATDDQVCFFNEVCSVTNSAVIEAKLLSIPASKTPPTSMMPSAAPSNSISKSVPTNEPSSINIPSIEPIDKTTTSPVKSASLLQNSGLSSGNIPLSFTYGIGNDAGLSGTEILFESNRNNVKDDLIYATKSLALEVANNLFSGDCKKNIFSGGCGLRNRRKLSVKFGINVLPTIDQVITVACPQYVINMRHFTSANSSHITDISENTTNFINITDTLNTSINFNSTDITKNTHYHDTTNAVNVMIESSNTNESSRMVNTTNTTEHGTASISTMSCANVISTVVLTLEEGSSSLIDISKRFSSAFLEEVKKGRLTELLPEETDVIYSGIEMKFRSPPNQTHTIAHAILENGSGGAQHSSGSHNNSTGRNETADVNENNNSLFVILIIVGVVAIALVTIDVVIYTRKQKRRNNSDCHSESTPGQDSCYDDYHDEDHDVQSHDIDENDDNEDNCSHGKEESLRGSEHYSQGQTKEERRSHRRIMRWGV